MQKVELFRRDLVDKARQTDTWTDGHMDTVIPVYPHEHFYMGYDKTWKRSKTKPHIFGKCYKTTKRHGKYCESLVNSRTVLTAFVAVFCQPCWISHDTRHSRRFSLWQTPELDSLEHVLGQLLPQTSSGCLIFWNLAHLSLATWSLPMNLEWGTGSKSGYNKKNFLPSTEILTITFIVI